MKNLTKVGKRWRYRKTIKGKNYSLYYDYKPRESDVLQDLSISQSSERHKKIPLETAMYDYVNSIDSNVSPSTYYGYVKMIKALKGDTFLKTNIYEINKYLLQKFINTYSSTHAPKTVKNVYSLIKLSIQLYREDFNPKINLPKNIREEPYVPTDENIKLLLQESKNTEFYIPISLGLMGMRLSEVNALTLSDIGDGTITINKAKVRGYGGYVTKTTKTQTSIRTIQVDKSITDLIKKQGYIYQGHIGNLSRFIRKFNKTHNIPYFGFHKLRHYYCSLMLSEGVPFQYVQKLGGWASDSVMKRVYTHALTDRDYSKIGVDYINKLSL